MSADLAHAKVDPCPSCFQTLFAAFATGFDGWIDQSEVSAVRHFVLLDSLLARLDSALAPAVTKK